MPILARRTTVRKRFLFPIMRQTDRAAQCLKRAVGLCYKSMERESLFSVPSRPGIVQGIRLSSGCSTINPLPERKIIAVKSEKPHPQEKPNPVGFRKVSFGAIAKHKPDSRTSYPLVPDPQGRFAAIAARILERSVQIEALTGAWEVDKAELKTLATPFYFTNASGKLDVPSSIGVTCPAGEMLITFQNRYGKLESEAPCSRTPAEPTSLRQIHT